MSNSSVHDSTMDNSSNPASPSLDHPSVSRSSNLVSPKREPPIGANSSNPVPPILENPTMANSSRQPSSPEQELPAMTNLLDQASPKQERSPLANSSNQPSPKRGPTAMANPLDQASPKRARIAHGNLESVTEDRLSCLPERARIRILEQLPLPTAIMVSRLSTRWVYLWARMSKLSFDQYSHPAFADFSVFASFVDAALLLCHPKLIRAMSFVMKSESDYHCRLPVWLGFVRNNNVKELELESRYVYEGGRECELPMALCFNSFILKLKLSFEHIKIPAGVCWRSLRCLSLERIYFPNDDMMDEIVAGCPALEELDMNGCAGVVVYDFSYAVSLKKFTMIHDMGDPDVGIHCGYLQYLYIQCSFDIRMYYLHDSSVLREVVLVGNDLEPFEKQIDGYSYLKDIICSLSHVDKLTLVGSCLELLAYLNVKSLPSPLPRLRNLVVHVHFSELDMLGLAAMLRSCPHLETLTIELDHRSNTMCGGEYEGDIEHELEPMETYWISQDINAFKCLRMNMKKVKIMSFGLDDCEESNLLQFIEFVLKHALMLEEVWVISEKTKERESAEKRLADIAQTLIRFKRSSPFVKIVFN